VVFRTLAGLAMALTTAASAAAGFDSFTSAMPAASSMMGAGGMSEGAKAQAMQDMQNMLDMMDVMRDVYHSRYGSGAGYPPVPGMPSAWPSPPGTQSAQWWSGAPDGYAAPQNPRYGAQIPYGGGYGAYSGGYRSAGGPYQGPGGYAPPARSTGSWGGYGSTPEYGGGTSPNLLDGVWEGTSGEVLEIRGNRFRIYADEQRHGNGLLSVNGDMLVWQIPSSGARFEHQFLLTGERLVLRDRSTGQMLLFQRRR